LKENRRFLKGEGMEGRIRLIKTKRRTSQVVRKGLSERGMNAGRGAKLGKKKGG